MARQEERSKALFRGAARENERSGGLFRRSGAAEGWSRASGANTRASIAVRKC